MEYSDLSGLLEGDPVALATLRRLLVEGGGDAQVQIAKYVVNIGEGRDLHIGDGVDPKRVAEAVRKAFEAIHASAAEASAMGYIRALEKLEAWGYLSTRQGARERPYLPLTLSSVDAASFTVDETPADQLLSPAFLARGRSLWIEGQAGSGKSTLLRHLARCAWFEPQAVGLQERRLPLYIRLTALAQSDAAHLSGRLLAALNASQTITTSTPISHDFLDAWPKLLGGEWLFLFDGLDEVTGEDRARIREDLDALIAEGRQLVVSSRPNFTDPDLASKGVTRCSLAPLGSEEQHRLAQALLGERADAFQLELKRNGSEAIGESPLLFTMAALHFEQNEALPNRRVDLYEQVTQEWLDRLRRQGAREEPALQDFWALTETVVEATALQMSLAPERVALRQIVPAIGQELAAQGANGKVFATPGVGGRMLRVIGQASGVVEVSHDAVGWLHATFREYFAARALARRQDGDPVLQDALKRVKDPSWSQIVLMLLTLRDPGPAVDGTLGDLAAQGPDFALLAGRALLEGVTTPVAMQRTILRAIADGAVADAEDNICSTLLTANRAQDRLAVLKALRTRKHLTEDYADLREALAERAARAPAPDSSNPSAAPQWLSYLAELDGAATLERLIGRKRLAPSLRALALYHLAEFDPKRALRLLGPLTAAVTESTTARAMLCAAAQMLGQDDVVREILFGPPLDWSDYETAIEKLTREGFAAMLRDAAIAQAPPRLGLALMRRANAEGLAKAQFDGRVARALRRHVEDSNAATSGAGIAGAALAEILTAWKARDPSLDLAPVYAYAFRDSAVGDFLAGLVAEVGPDGLRSWCADPTMPSQMRLLLLRQVLVPDGPATSLVKRVADIVRDGKLLGGGPPGESATRSLLAATLAGRRGSHVAQRRHLKAASEGVDSGRLFAVDISVNSAWIALEWLTRIRWLDDGDPQGALDGLQAHMDKLETNPQARLLRGKLRYEVDETEGAIDDLHWGLHRHFEIEPIAKLADLYRQVGRFQEAEEYGSMLEDDADWGHIARVARGATRLLLAPERAMADFDHILVDRPDWLFARIRRALLHRLAGDIDAARADIDHVLPLWPDSEEAATLCVELAGEAGKPMLGALPKEMRDWDGPVAAAAFLRFLSAGGEPADAKRAVGTIRKAFAEDLEHGATWLYRRARLAVYATFLPGLGDPDALFEDAIEGSGILVMIELGLPLCDLVSRRLPARRHDAARLVARIQQAIRDRGGTPPDNYHAAPFPTSDYPFPMYCQLSGIAGLEAFEARSKEVLAAARLGRARAMVVLSIDGQDRIYGRCNFKKDPGGEYPFKFCDTLGTTLGANLRAWVYDMGVSRMLFTEPALKARAEAIIDREMPVVSMLIPLDD